jgi:rod shape-determining protein MreD
MTYILWIGITLFIFFIEDRISVFHVSPNFITVLVYYAGITKGGLGGLFLGSIIGFIDDSLSGNLLGPNLLSKGMVGYFASFMSGSFFRWTPLLGAIGIGVLTIIDNTIVFITRSFFDQMPTTMKSAAFIIFIQSIINIPLGLFIRPKNIQKTGQ